MSTVQIALNEKVTRAIAEFASTEKNRPNLHFVRIEEHPSGVGVRMIATNGHVLIVSHLPTSYIIKSTIPSEDNPKYFYLYAGKSLLSRFRGVEPYRGLCTDRPDSTPFDAKLKALEFEKNAFGEYQNSWSGEPVIGDFAGGFPRVENVTPLNPKVIRKTMESNKVALLNRHFLAMLARPISESWESGDKLAASNAVEFFSSPEKDYQKRAHYAISRDDSVMVLIMPIRPDAE